MSVHLRREEISSVLLRTYYVSGIVPGAGDTRMTKTQCQPSGSLKCLRGDRNTGNSSLSSVKSGAGWDMGDSPARGLVVFVSPGSFFRNK